MQVPWPLMSRAGARATLRLTSAGSWASTTLAFPSSTPCGAGPLTKACGRTLNPGAARRRVPNPETDKYGDLDEPWGHGQPKRRPRVLSCQAWFGSLGGASVLHSATQLLHGEKSEIAVTAHMRMPRALKVHRAHAKVAMVCDLLVLGPALPRSCGRASSAIF